MANAGILGALSRSEIKARLDEARSVPANRYCGDCGALEPQIAIVNIGMFVCQRCVTVHREMGIDISKLKSMQLDLSWTPEWLENLKEGNEKANATLEAELPHAYRRPHPDENTSLRRQFILAKYKRREFCSKLDVVVKKSEKEPAPVDPPYLEGKMSGKLLKRGRSRDEWLPRRFDLSMATDSLSYYKPQPQEQDHPLRRISIRALNAMLLDSESLNLVGPTVLLLAFPEEEQNKIGTASGSHGNSIKTRHIFLRGFDCQQGQDVVEWYVAIRHAKILALNLPPSVEPTHDFTRMGWMNKRGKSLSDAFKRRWFILDQKMLRYYDSPMDATAIGEIPIGSSKQGYAVTDGIPGDKRLSFFSFTLVTPGRSYWLRGMSFEDQLAWMGALEGVICDEIRRRVASNSGELMKGE